MDDLLKTHASIEEKYNIAREKLENARQAFENVQKKAYYHKQDELQIKRKYLEEEYIKNRKQIMDAFNNWQHDSDERLQILLVEQNKADSALKELRHWNPKADEIKQVDDELQKLNFKEKENTILQAAVKSQIDRITAEYRMKETEIKQESQHEQDRLESERITLREQMAKIDDILAHLDGSLYKWLCDNSEGWENTIGKVVDEERILYAQGLEPQLDTESNGLFGIKLNLDNIASVHRTPDDYRLEKSHLEEQVQHINRRLAQLPINLQEEISKLGKKHAAQINPLRQKRTSLRVEEGQIPVKRQNLQTSRHKFQMEEQELIKQEKDIRERSYNESVLHVNSERETRDKNKSKNKKDLKNLDSSLKRLRIFLKMNYVFSKIDKRMKPESVIRSFPNRKSNLMNSRQQNLPEKVLIQICLRNIV